MLPLRSRRLLRLGHSRIRWRVPQHTAWDTLCLPWKELLWNMLELSSAWAVEEKIRSTRNTSVLLIFNLPSENKWAYFTEWAWCWPSQVRWRYTDRLGSAFSLTSQSLIKAWSCPLWQWMYEVCAWHKRKWKVSSHLCQSQTMWGVSKLLGLQPSITHRLLLSPSHSSSLMAEVKQCTVVGAWRVQFLQLGQALMLMEISLCLKYIKIWNALNMSVWLYCNLLLASNHMYVVILSLSTLQSLYTILLSVHEVS